MPKKFVFRLETVLAHRRAIEEERAGELARATQARLAQERAIGEIDERERASYEEQALLLASGDFTAMDLSGYVSFRQGLETRREQARLALARAQREEDGARRLLVEARKEREALSRLKENQFKAWQAELDLAERKLMDELATQAFTRPKPQDG